MRTDDAMPLGGARLALALVGLSAAMLAGVAGRSALAAEIVTLSQVACQFVESENGVDHGFTTTRKADCEAINEKTAERRLAEARPLTLKAGEYVFRVENKDVPYELGFWLREKGYDWRNPLHKLSKVSVSGGGLTAGTTKDYAVTLAPGEYVYSCPLNTTPDYRLVVEE